MSAFLPFTTGWWGNRLHPCHPKQECLSSLHHLLQNTFCFFENEKSRIHCGFQMYLCNLSLLCDSLIWPHKKCMIWTLCHLPGISLCHVTSLQVKDLAAVSLKQPVRIFVNSNTDVAPFLRQEFVRIRANKEGDREAVVAGRCNIPQVYFVCITMDVTRTDDFIPTWYKQLDMACVNFSSHNSVFACGSRSGGCLAWY